MILKIRNGLTWVFRDDISRIRIYDPQKYVGDEKTGGVTFLEGEGKARDAHYFDGYYGILNDGCEYYAREVYIRLKSGSERVLLIGGEVYLLNDAGQTIEKFAP